MVIVTRDVAIPFLANVRVAIVTRTIRGLLTEVRSARGMDCATSRSSNCDNLFTVAKSTLGTRLGNLDPTAQARLNVALRVVLELD